MTNPEAKKQAPIFWDPQQPVEARVDDIVAKLTLEEKVSQMVHYASAIPRLGIPEYNWWNECLHGVGRAGVATVFPQSIGLAAAFNQEGMFRTAAIIADEARAKHHEFVRHDDREIYKGLTYWTPNVNIFRDPRWGRGQETYGEDPYLTGRLGTAFVKGLQGDHPKYLKLIATPKHYAVHSGPEPLRHSFDAVVSPKDLWETYLPAFKECVTEAGAMAIMGAYNRTNGEPCCASPTLLQTILREQWGFKGHVVSDCGAIEDIHAHHQVTDSAEASAALAVTNGCDLCCGRTFESLVSAAQQGLIPEEDIDKAVKRLFDARLRLGMFDPEDAVPYAQIPYEVNDCEEHRRAAHVMAQESMVLLKNDGMLPFGDDIRSLAVIGPNADSKDVLLGNYYGTPSAYVTALDGLRQAAADRGAVVRYAEGCDLTTTETDMWGTRAVRGFSEALSAAERSDAVVLCLGFSPALEGEEGAVAASDGGGDRTDIDLPGVQEELLQAVTAVGKPVVVVLFSGSPIAVNWAEAHANAILHAWYPGEEGGTAIADMLFGRCSPAGRLPMTFVKSLDQLPEFTDYGMQGRTYRYMLETPLYPFGYGLSYTTFTYSDLTIGTAELAAGEAQTVSATVTNSGGRASDEVVQLYLHDEDASVPAPRFSLQGFRRIHLQPGESQTVTFTLTTRQLALIDNEGRCVLEPGRFRVWVGGRQPDERSAELTGTPVLEGMFRVVGEPRDVAY